MVSQRHYQRTSQRPMATAHLAQTMTLLGLNNLELLEKIQGELAENPALEFINENRCPTCRRKLAGRGLCPRCSLAKSTIVEDPIVFVSSRQDFYTPSRYASEGASIEDYSVQEEDLPTFVLGQIATELKPADRPIAAHILTSLNEDGLLTVPVVEIARYHHKPLSQINQVLDLIKRAEPIGVGASTPQEALLAQLSVLRESKTIDPLIEQAIGEGLDLLSKRQHLALSKRLGISSSHAKKITDFISENLNPFPGRAYWGSSRHPEPQITERYRTPDVLISKAAQSGTPQLIVEILSPISGTLRINAMFRKALKDAPPEKSELWTKAIENANLLIKCLSQRNNTLVQVMQLLAKKQRDFILNGEAFMHPLTRAALAEEIGVHESTISRAVANKSVQLPTRQIIPIARFFDRSLHIRTAIKSLIGTETKPLSDSKITKLLEKQGHQIARRTVAKYRNMEGILPAHLRG